MTARPRSPFPPGAGVELFACYVRGNSTGAPRPRAASALRSWGGRVKPHFGYTHGGARSRQVGILDHGPRFGLRAHSRPAGRHVVGHPRGDVLGVGDLEPVPVAVVA